MLLITTNYMFLLYSFIYSMLCIVLSNTESNLSSIGIVHLISFILLIESHSNLGNNQILSDMLDYHTTRILDFS
jgi:hypothetical protein